jgi:hypothetical protein
MIAITIVPLQQANAKSMNFDDVTDEQLKGIVAENEKIQGKTWQNVRTLESGRTRIGGKTAVFFKWSGSYEAPAGTLQAVHLMFVVLHGGKEFTITCCSLPESFDKVLPEFLRAVSLFVFEDDYYRDKKKDGTAVPK